MNNDCPICLEVINQDVFITTCIHRFHNKCFTEYVQKSSNHRCPICRHDTKISEDTSYENIPHEDRNFRRREEGRERLNHFLHFFENQNTIETITSLLRRNQRIQQSTENSINAIGSNIVRTINRFLTN